VTQLEDRTAGVIRDVSDARRPMVITQNGEVKAVVPDVQS